MMSVAEPAVRSRWQGAPALISRLRAGLAGVMIVALGGCSANTLNGRVMTGDSSYIQWVNGGTPGGNEPVGGAAITVTRDPLSPGRQVVGSGVSSADGSFSIPLDAFGAGWTDEPWLIVAERRGAGRAEYLGRLESGRSLLILLAPGTERGRAANDLWNGDIGTMPSGSQLMDEAKRYR